MHLSSRSLRREILEGRLPARGKRRTTLIRRADIRAWIEARQLRPVRDVAIKDDAQAADRVAKRAHLRLAGGAR
jgi:hypothetical protein